MSSAAPEGDEFPLPEIDANGVDRAQIRAALRLTPVERLRRAEQFAEGTLPLWEQNGIQRCGNARRSAFQPATCEQVQQMGFSPVQYV